MHSLRADSVFFLERNNDLPLSVIELQIPVPVACGLVERAHTRKGYLSCETIQLHGQSIQLANKQPRVTATYMV